MYSPEEVFSIVSEKIAVLKKTRGKDYSFGESYSYALKNKEKLRPHYDTDYFPEKLFKERAPNQTQKEYDYIKGNYKAITYIVWDRFKTVLRRIWNDTNWSVQSWGEIEQQYINAGYDSKDYFENKYPKFTSLENFYKTIVTDFKEKDPNAVIAHRPESVPLKKIGEEYVIDDSIIVNPVACIFPCEKVVDFYEGKYFIGISNEKSIIRDVKEDKKEGVIFEFYDENNIWFIKQVGKKYDWDFEISLYWNHNIGELPCAYLKSEPEYKECGIVYKSAFSPAVEPLDLCLLDSAYLMVAKARHIFPKFWEYQTDCDHQDSKYGSCQSGYLYDENQNKVMCPQCKGSGKRSLSPFGTYVVPMPDRMSPETANISLPPAGYITPEITTPEFLDKQIEKNITLALSMLNLQYSNTNAQGGDTALGRQIDREEMFSFLLNISSQLFHLFEFSFAMIQKMRYGADAIPPSISYPKNFSIRNEYDLSKEITDAKVGGMPDIGIRQLIKEYYAIRFTNSEQSAKIVDIVFETDRLVTLSNSEIQIKLSYGSIAKWEDILHTSISLFIENLINKNPLFLDLPIEAQKTLLIKEAKKKEKEITPTIIDANAIIAGTNQGDNPDGDPTDIEAEAKARLKGSVGGVQGIIQIQEGVSSGTTDYEAAVTMLYEIYGFDDATARRLLGNPVDLRQTKEKIPADA